MTFYTIFCAKLDFQIFNPAVIPSEEPALEASTALLGRKNFEGWTKMSKIEKCENLVDLPSESQKMTFYMIFCAKLDF